VTSFALTRGVILHINAVEMVTPPRISAFNLHANRAVCRYFFELR